MFNVRRLCRTGWVVGYPYHQATLLLAPAAGNIQSVLRSKRIVFPVPSRTKLPEVSLRAREAMPSALPLTVVVYLLCCR